MNNDKIQPSKLDIILEKKQNLDATIQECEIRIDAKLASLIDDGFISREVSAEVFEAAIQDPYQPGEHFLSGVDISDDDALDQAVLNSRPFETRTNRLAFDGDRLTNQPSQLNDMAGFSTPIGEIEDDEELPTLSKILGRTTPTLMNRSAQPPSPRCQSNQTLLINPHQIQLMRFSNPDFPKWPNLSLLQKLFLKHRNPPRRQS